MGQIPRIVGIVNVTKDSFSDGGLFLDSASAIRQAEKLAEEGADIIDLGPAASNPDAEAVSAEEEVRRLAPIIAQLRQVKISISVDSFQTVTQRYAISQDVNFLNDIQGFSDPHFYTDLASARCKLIVMHAMQNRGHARRVDVSPEQAWEHLLQFFDKRLSKLVAAGVARERLILDPGMGFFLSARPETSFRVLARLGDLRVAFGLPLLISVSRKSFLRTVTGRDIRRIGPATLAAEMLAALAGVSYIRTHDVASLKDGLSILSAVRSQATEDGGKLR